MLASVSTAWLDNLARDAFTGDRQESQYGFHMGSTDDLVNNVDPAFTQEDFQQEVVLARLEAEANKAQRS